MAGLAPSMEHLGYQEKSSSQVAVRKSSIKFDVANSSARSTLRFHQAPRALPPLENPDIQSGQLISAGMDFLLYIPP